MTTNQTATVFDDHFKGERHFFKASGAIGKIGSSLKSNPQEQIWLALLCETHCMMSELLLFLQKPNQ